MKLRERIAKLLMEIDNGDMAQSMQYYLIKSDEIIEMVEFYGREE